MFTKTNWTDPQGSVFDEAVFEVSEASLHSSRNENFSFRISAGDSVDSFEENSNENMNLNYQMFYWASQDARDQGKPPYILANTDPNQIGMVFYAESSELTKPEYDGLSAKQMAEYHVQNVVMA